MIKKHIFFVSFFVARLCAGDFEAQLQRAIEESREEEEVRQMLAESARMEAEREVKRVEQEEAQLQQAIKDSLAQQELRQARAAKEVERDAQFQQAIRASLVRQELEQGLKARKRPEDFFRRLVLFIDINASETKPDDFMSNQLYDFLNSDKYYDFPILLSSNLLWNVQHRFDVLISQEFYLFDVPESNFLFLLPKDYAEEILDYRDLRFTDKEEEILGFRIMDLKKHQIQLPEKRITDKLTVDIEQLAQKKPKKFNVGNLAEGDYGDIGKVIVTQEKDAPISYYWNIYLAGHGTLEKNPAQVAGLPLPQFQDLLQFFNQKTNTNLLYYVTCYGASEQVLESFKVFDRPGMALHYILASRGIRSSAVYAPKFDLREFFRALEEQKPFETVFQEVEVSGISIPQLRFPGTDWFSALNINKKVLIINKAKIIAHLAGRKPFDARDKKVILIYSDVVPMPLIIDASDVEIEPMVLGKKKRTTYFEDILVKSIQHFILENLSGKSNALSGQKLLIKTLSVQEPFERKQILHEVTIETDPIKKSFAIAYVDGQRLHMFSGIYDPKKFAFEMRGKEKFSLKLFPDYLINMRFFEPRVDELRKQAANYIQFVQGRLARIADKGRGKGKERAAGE